MLGATGGEFVTGRTPGRDKGGAGLFRGGSKAKCVSITGERSRAMGEAGGKQEGTTLDGLARMLRDGKITRRGFLVRAAGLVGGLAAAEGLLARVAGAQTTRKTQ